MRRKAGIILAGSFLFLTTAIFVSGCHTAQTNQAQAPEEEFIIGKTTKAEVVSKLGKPTGTAKNRNGEETLTYNKNYITGKGFIPYYFGSDKYRISIKHYTFDKNGILTDSVEQESHH